MATASSAWPLAASFPQQWVAMVTLCMRVLPPRPNFDEPEGTIVYTRIDGNTPDTGDYDLEVKNVTYYMYAAARPDAIAPARDC